MSKFLLFLILLIFPFFVWADNSGNSNGYAWFEKIGWVHFSGEDAGVDYGIKISSDQITGYAWSEKTGWISLNCLNSFSCNGQPYGVVSDGEGNLSGYAWSEKVGWINFNGVGTVEYQVQIDSNGNLSGYAWSEKAGWINTDDIGENYGVTTVAGEGYCEDCVPCNPPVLAWNLDEGIGTIAYDSSFRGNNIYNNGAVAGGAVWQSQSECVSGGCLYFDGNDDNVNRPYDTDLSFKENSFSIGGWFKTSTISTPAYLFSRYDTAGWKVWLDADGDACFGIDDDNVWSGETPDDFICTTGKNYDDNNWHYILAEKDVTGGIYLYLDGREEVSDLTLTATGSISGTSPIFYAGVNSDGVSSSFSGFLDAIKIYDYARSADQIKQDYNEGTARIVSPRGTGAAIGRNLGTLLGDPILDLNFDEGQGPTAYDASGNNNHGTLVSGATGGNTTPTMMWDKGGKKNGAMEFDGTDDTVAISNFQFPISNQFSMSQYLNLKTLGTDEPLVGEWGASQNNILLKLDNTNNDELRICIAGTLTDACTIYGRTTDLNLTVNQWRNVQVIYDGTQSTNVDKLKLYVDGQKKTLTFTGTIPATIQSASTAGLSIGGNSGDHTNFLIDELKIFSYPISEDEIKTLYNDSSAMVMGNDESRDNNGTEVTGANKDYCIPGDTARCDKPVLELKFDEKQGGTAFDTSGNGNNGSIVGALWDRGKVNSGLRFVNINDHVNTNFDPNLGVDSFTIELAIKMNSDSDYAIFGSRAGVSIFGEEITLGINKLGSCGLLGDKYLYALIADDSTIGFDYFCSSRSYTDNQWYNISLVFDQVLGQISLYTDGIYSGGKLISNVGDGNKDFSGFPFYLGARNYGNSPTTVSKTDIDEFKFYNYARTPAQIAWDYNRGKPMGHWKMDESSGTQVDDWSGNANHGTMTNMDPIGDRVEGKNNKALDFDGVDDTVAISNFQFSSSNQFSMSQYVNFKTLATGKPIVGEWGGNQNNILIKTDDTNSDELKICIASSLNDACANYATTTDLNLTADQWIHIQAVYNGAGATDADKLKLYINGTSKTLSFAGTIPATIQSASTAGITIGGNSGAYINAILDDLKIYNYALTEEQIKLDYNGGAVNFR